MDSFDYTLNYKKLDLRKNPHLYRVGKGEQGVLLVEPYKSEILPFWRFKTPEEATTSSKHITKLFFDYLKNEDFVGMDMARKFMQMGFTRSSRYANHAGGKKYDGPMPMDKKGVSGAHGRSILPRNVDKVKAESARIFYEAWKKIEEVDVYKILKHDWKIWFG